MEDILYIFLKNKEFMFYLSCILISIMFCVVYKLYVKVGLRKTIIIAVEIAALLLVIHYIRVEMVRKYPYECASDIYYCEAYEYCDDINTGPVPGRRYTVQYKYGQLICVYDVPSYTDMASYKVRLNHREKKEFKQIFKKYNMLGLIKTDEAKKIGDTNIDKNEMNYNEYFFLRTYRQSRIYL